MPTPQSGSLASCALGCLSSSDVRTLTGCEAETCYCNNSTNLQILNDCVDKSCPKGVQGTDRDDPFFGESYCSKSNSGMTINQVDTSTSLVQLNSVSSSRLLSSTVSSSIVTTTATANNGAAATAVNTTLPAINTGTMPPFPSERKPAAAIIGGAIGGISAVICITTITIHKVRNRRRRKRALARLAELQERNFDSGYEVNGISGAGGDEGSQSTWSGGSIVSFVLDGRNRRGTVMTTGSRL
ncbi:hypothetical protein EYR41_003501 [Orbilia oligospora]|uniref:CFEM domain-containing protein n=1 Tax=Orbilia oligospora TaxID=2813651 RepID=A0A7C8PEM1_ORBOL|nr:hypothetical protein TWF751_009556 [Orbilia oligospora]TGJ71540.1 hypothetical protein EYR41_003501 [Orbilia oligospora]